MRHITSTALLALALIGCGPVRVDPLVEIDTSETAFLVPLEGDTSAQSQFDSVEYFESAKVATKRITIPQRRRYVGRLWFSYKWVPTMRVIKVNRAPITKKWRDKNSLIHVESRDSIGFAVGVNLTAQIDEANAATFLYNYGEKDLDTAIDENVRSFLVSVLSREFGNRDLVECKADKGVISQIAFSETAEHFKGKGITITNLGLTDGLTYEDQAIQDAINATFIAEQEALTAEQREIAATAEAKVQVAKAQGEAQAAEEFARAKSAREALVRLDIERMRAEAALEWAKKWNGVLPNNVLPADSPLMLNVNGPQ